MANGLWKLRCRGFARPQWQRSLMKASFRKMARGPRAYPKRFRRGPKIRTIRNRAWVRRDLSGYDLLKRRRDKTVWLRGISGARAGYFMTRRIDRVCMTRKR